jgi:glycosyltransferase involved in cell wall biosynthesis
VEWWTGLETILRLFAEDNTLRNTLYLLVLGDGPALKNLREMTRAHALTDCVIFLGRVPYETVPLYLTLADVGLCVISKEKMAATGSSAQKLRQYLACGLPVMASAGDGHGFIGEEKLGWVVELERPESIRAAFATMLALSPDEKQQLRSRAADYAQQHFSTRTLAQQRLKAWDEVLQ